MQIYCEKCREPQKDNEKICSKCGAALGGETWVLVAGVFLVIFLPTIIIISGNDIKELINIKFFFWYELPVIVATAFLYDHDSKRRSIYFWGGSAIIVGSLYKLLS